MAGAGGYDADVVEQSAARFPAPAGDVRRRAPIDARPATTVVTTSTRANEGIS